MKKKLYAAVLTSTLIIPAVIQPVQASSSFQDIPTSSPYAEAITLLTAQKVMTGYHDGTFRPNDIITRQHVIAVLNKLVDFQPIREAKTFQDVPVTHPYYEVIQSAYRAGIIDGYADHTCKPDTPITRAQMAKMIAVAFQLQASTTITFQDVVPTDWSSPYIQAIAQQGITTTKEGFYRPNEWLTRGQFALFAYRLWQMKEEQTMTYSGDWQGKIDIPQNPLTVQLHLEEDGTGTFSIPAQGVTNYPVQSVTAIDDTVRVEINLAGSILVIEGKVEKNRITATFTQNHMAFPLVLTPYEPPEVTYEEWVVPVSGGDLKVAVEWPSIETTEPVPVAVIIAGSGPTTKDGNTVVGENNSLKMLAEGLAAQGIATVRYDKRGVGDNMGLVAKEEDIVFDMYAKDVEDIVNMIEADPRFSSVHLIGHSEGSLVGMVAARSAKVDSIISLAGSGRPMEELLLEQLTVQLPEELLQTSREILQSLKKGERYDNVPESLYSLFRPSVQPYMISWLQYHPADVLKSLDVPTLIIQGKNDLQVQVTDAEQLHLAKPTAEVVYFDTMNHVLKEASTDKQENFATYANPTLPLADGLVDCIHTFILKNK